MGKYNSISCAGGKLKEVGTEYWNEPNVGATDEFGFSARPTGALYYAPVEPPYIKFFGGEGEWGIWAVSTPVINGWTYLTISNNGTGPGYTQSVFDYTEAQSVRCLKD